jgi:hypothetical protein
MVFKADKVSLIRFAPSKQPRFHYFYSGPRQDEFREWAINFNQQEIEKIMESGPENEDQAQFYFAKNKPMLMEFSTYNLIKSTSSKVAKHGTILWTDFTDLALMAKLTWSYENISP